MMSSRSGGRCAGSDGYEYTISREHPLIADALAGSSGPAVEGILKMIETTLPVDLIGSRPSAAPPEDAEAET